MKRRFLCWIHAGSLNIFGLTKHLQNEIDGDFFAIYDFTEKPKKFLRKQKLVDFKKIWFYNESIKKNHQSPDTKYLSEFEEKYGIKLWKLAANERIFIFNEFYQFSTNEILSIIEQECKFYEDILNEINPDYVLMLRPYFHYDTIFYQLCVAKGIQVLDLDTSRFPNRSIISSKNPSYNLEKHGNNGVHQKSELEIKYEKFTNPDKIRSFGDLQKYRKNNLAFGKGTDYEGTSKDFISAGLEYFFTSNKIINRNYKYFGRSKFKVLINYINDIFRQRRRERFIEKNFLKEFNKEDKFVLFLLAVDSESSTLLDTAFYINQIEVAKNIVKSLPIEYRLLVKEHPASGLRSWRKIDVYKELIDTPNVVPIHYSANTEELIKKSSLVISLSGSTSLDALFFEKPSIVFADTDYSMIPEVRKIDKIENLSNTIHDALKTRVDPKNIEKYVQFIEKNSFDYNFILHVMEMQKYVYHGSLLVDVEFSEEELNKFFDKTKSEFTKLTRAYVEKINDDIQSNKL